MRADLGGGRGRGQAAPAPPHATVSARLDARAGAGSAWKGDVMRAQAVMAVSGGERECAP
ncbi:hypothetical protein MBELCI_0092 [Limimaricola cinnabarinus LL-001]|uniref:Uncharacterized protein n=1 Tax=Limimaricola cinnabarinus LL-001 TaxID=1337093 RepID=U2YY99_9RHOB|nr:hypothetical protein MBELCI_0092 [Limimaricola cinnabarinus LL-001]